MQPFRVKYLDYVKSEPTQTIHGLSYHVHFAEHEGAPKVGFWEKFAGRDFGIGANVGAVIGTAILMAATLPLSAAGLAFAEIAAATQTVAPMCLGLVGLGGALGGISDYLRNDREMVKGAYIDPPSYFNRDTILNSLSMSTTVGMIAGIGMMALAVAGSPVTFAVGLAINIGSLVAGGIYGGIEGAKEGYERMQAEYTAAEEKYKNPHYKVALSQKHEHQLDELVSNEAALGVSILPLVVAGLAKTDDTPQLNHKKPSTHLQTNQLKHEPPHDLVPERVLF
jgi:hypothetical protein